MFTFSSCSKTDDINLTRNQKGDTSGNSTEAIIIDEKDLSESSEDLTTVDYKNFYDQLSPFGEWLEVRPDEVGLQLNTAGSEYSHSELLSLSDIIGVKKYMQELKMRR
ncbi:MAG: hypothetical protein IPM96_21455 [Ignavibacteria bacterium]|nr:hypothetical protein [Ignavibacteria bacterium]